MEKWYVTLGNSIAVGDRILYRPVEVESIEEAEANAERIVRAVNCHDDLVEALKELPEPKSLLEDAAYTGGDVPRKWINDRGHFNDGYNQALKDVAKRRERALAKVEAL